MLNLQIQNQIGSSGNFENNENSMSSGNSIEQEELMIYKQLYETSKLSSGGQAISALNTSMNRYSD